MSDDCVPSKWSGLAFQGLLDDPTFVEYLKYLKCALPSSLDIAALTQRQTGANRAMLATCITLPPLLSCSFCKKSRSATH
jgi:hypothetical protein